MGFKEVVITDSGKECLDEIPTIIRCKQKRKQKQEQNPRI